MRPRPGLCSRPGCGWPVEDDAPAGSTECGWHRTATSQCPTYAYVGTYADGVTRSGHVTTNDLPLWVDYMTHGVLPFESIVTTPCANPFTCNH